MKRRHLQLLTPVVAIGVQATVALNVRFIFWLTGAEYIPAIALVAAAMAGLFGGFLWLMASTEGF